MSVHSCTAHVQVSPEQALAAFLAKLESEQLSLYVQQTELQILQPLHTYT